MMPSAIPSFFSLSLVLLLLLLQVDQTTEAAAAFAGDLVKRNSKHADEIVKGFAEGGAKVAKDLDGLTDRVIAEGGKNVGFHVSSCLSLM